MRHRIQEDVDRKGIAVDGKPQEVIRIVTLALPRIPDVGIVRDERHHVVLRIEYAACMRDRTVAAGTTLEEVLTQEG